MIFLGFAFGCAFSGWLWWLHGWVYRLRLPTILLEPDDAQGISESVK